MSALRPVSSPSARPGLRGRLAALALAAGLMLPGAAAADDFLQFTGSTSILPIVTDAANAFREQFGTWDKVDPALPAQEIVIYTAGGGSSAGVRAAIDGSAHVGMANRDLREQEKESLGPHELHVIGIDGIAIAAHRDSPLFTVTRDLSSDQVAQLFSGEIGRFNEFDDALPDREIVLLMRDASGGNTQIMQNRILKERTFSPAALQQPSTGTQLRRLESNANAIAYISSGVIWRSDEVEPFALDGVEPTQANLVDGSYPLQRQMLLIVRGEASPKVKAFIDYLLSEDGQAIVDRHDYVPVSLASN